MISRRNFLKLAGAGGLTLGLGPTAAPFRALRAQSGPALLGTARNCIFVFLEGGSSHVDTFDFKEGSWTPGWMGGASLVSGARWPSGIMPELAQRDQLFSLMRAIEGREIEHSRATYFWDNARAVNPAFQNEIPGIGSVLAFELGQNNGPGAVFPPYVSINRTPPAPGFLGSAHAGYRISGLGGAAALDHPYGEDAYHRRFQALGAMDPARARPVENGSALVGYQAFYQQADALMFRDDVLAALELDEGQRARYSPEETPNSLGDACLLGFQLLKQRFGVRFIHIGGPQWDDHFGIYNVLQRRLPLLDTALANLLDDLAATPGEEPGRTLLDETLVIAMGEFGRTPGPLNERQGRDHWMFAFSALMAGGGVRGGAHLGQTDDQGARIVDPGWSAGRPATHEDLLMTIYSALGVDYRKTVADTPSGRTFQYIPPSPGAPSGLRPVHELFS